MVCNYTPLAWNILLISLLVSVDYSLGSSNQKNCDFDSFPGTTQVCKLDVSQFDQCSSTHAYGYNNSSPCIFIKLNRIYGWMPEFYNDPNDLPEDMPADLKAYISELPEMSRNQIWVSCRGENGADREVLGDVKYYPTRGFPSYFFPYLNAPGYLSPLVAVKFVRPARKYPFLKCSIFDNFSLARDETEIDWKEKSIIFIFFFSLSLPLFFISKSNHKYWVSSVGKKYKICRKFPWSTGEWARINDNFVPSEKKFLILFDFFLSSSFKGSVHLELMVDAPTN